MFAFLSAINQTVCENLFCMICINKYACVRDVKICEHYKRQRYDANQCVAINDWHH